jgi:hypothetical protein
MLVKFEEEEKKNPTVQPTEIDIDKLSLEAGKIEAEFEKDKYTPTEDELKKLEEELVKLNEQKFGTLEGPTGTNGPDDSGVEGINEPDKKVLNYLRRDA